MLLVHHDQAQVGEGQEQRAAGAHHHRRRPVRNGSPGDPPGAGGEVRVPHGRRHAEAGGEPLQPLRGQRDFGQQHQGLAAGGDAFGHGFQIDLGLARSRHAIQQGDGELPCRNGAAQAFGGGGLRGGQRGAGVGRVGQGEGRTRRQRHRQQQPGVRHATHDAAADVRGAGQVGRGQQSAVRQRRGDADPGVGQAGIGRDVADAPPRLRRFGLQRVDPQRHRQHLPGRGQGVARDPVNEAAQRHRERHGFQDGRDRLQLGVGNRWAGGQVPDDADLLPPVQRHQDHIAGARVHARGDGVVEGALERTGQKHRHPLPDRRGRG